MNPKINETCKFSFVNGFEALDGIYLVTGILSLDDILNLNISIVDSTYAKVNKTLADYQIDVVEFKNDEIYKLVHVTTDDIIYMPTSFFRYTPDPNVFEYLKLAFAVNIGIFKDQTMIEWVQNKIKEELQAVAGIDNDPILFETESVWMTEDEYAIIESDRFALIGSISNHYTDKQALLLENQRLKTLVQKYEQTIKLLNT